MTCKVCKKHKKCREQSSDGNTPFEGYDVAVNNVEELCKDFVDGSPAGNSERKRPIVVSEPVAVVSAKPSAVVELMPAEYAIKVIATYLMGEGYYKDAMSDEFPYEKIVGDICHKYSRRYRKDRRLSKKLGRKRCKYSDKLSEIESRISKIHYV